MQEFINNLSQNEVTLLASLLTALTMFMVSSTTHKYIKALRISFLSLFNSKEFDLIRGTWKGSFIQDEIEREFILNIRKQIFWYKIKGKFKSSDDTDIRFIAKVNSFNGKILEISHIGKPFAKGHIYLELKKAGIVLEGNYVALGALEGNIVGGYIYLRKIIH